MSGQLNVETYNEPYYCCSFSATVADSSVQRRRGLVVYCAPLTVDGCRDPCSSYGATTPATGDYDRAPSSNGATRQQGEAKLYTAADSTSQATIPTATMGEPLVVVCTITIEVAIHGGAGVAIALEARGIAG